MQLVSFTVDPKDDTPAVLSAYADRLGADPQHWWFLTGPEKPLYDLIQNGFYQAVQDNHGKKLDPGKTWSRTAPTWRWSMRTDVMRGFYQGLDADDQASLLKAIHQLENE